MRQQGTLININHFDLWHICNFPYLTNVVNICTVCNKNIDMLLKENFTKIVKIKCTKYTNYKHSVNQQKEKFKTNQVMSIIALFCSV